MTRNIVRPRLRTKSGCLQCRTWKKKCDERKPSCLGCIQHRRACIWPTISPDRRLGKRKPKLSRASSASPSCPSPGEESLLSASSSLIRQSTASHTPDPDTKENYNPFNQINWYPVNMATDQDRLLFHHFSTCTLPTAIRAHAHPVYATYQDVYHFAFQVPDIMKVFLGIAALRIGQNSKNSEVKATQLYSPSVNALRRSIENGTVNGTEEWLLILIAFMVIFETSRFDVSSNVMLHLGGVAQLFRIRKAKQIRPDPRKPFHRIAAEAFTYHLATYSLLYGNLDYIAGQFTWADLEGYDEVMPCPEASNVANSPIIGSQFELFRIIFEITRLSRHTPLTGLNTIKALHYKQQLDMIQQRLTQDLNFEDEGDEHESKEGALLYTLATQLFLFKVMNPEVDTENSTIRHISSQALLFVDKCRVNVACNSYFCWPLIILACAVRTQQGKEVIERKMAECRRWIHSGQIHRTSNIIKVIWEDDISDDFMEVSRTIERPKGLDRLLHKDGLADTFILSDGTDSSYKLLGSI